MSLQATMKLNLRRNLYDSYKKIAKKKVFNERIIENYSVLAKI